ncbi:uncharacterized protein BDZ99DRAFT_471478 [Mytilinidion resinicola]|uniref:Uncharacterized protein n=1 Tax=Mytilinidion resinicola TaxID=574789 RepID=A0A6A6Z512_9PEZI|nr:uncharacterized protein BDZ99DRAFT_471478 [Mytilinidion resinicola]KAF2816221.1 hypothetical protein BDZ99DRAFT_471478 [Mytilinidion resinicola]
MSGPPGYPPQWGQQQGYYNTGQPQGQNAHPYAQGFQFPAQAPQGNPYEAQTPSIFQHAGPAPNPMAHPNVQGFQFPAQTAQSYQYSSPAAQTPQYSAQQPSPQSHARNRHTAMGGGQPVFVAPQQGYQAMVQGQGQGAATGAATRLDPRFPGYPPVPQISPQWRQ